MTGKADADTVGVRLRPSVVCAAAFSRADLFCLAVLQNKASHFAIEPIEQAFLDLVPAAVDKGLKLGREHGKHGRNERRDT